jgi:hypothetical protein
VNLLVCRIVVPFLVTLFCVLCSCRNNHACHVHRRASLTVDVILLPDTFDFTSFAFIALTCQYCSPNDVYVHTMLQMYTSRASSALSQARPALAFSAKNLIQYSCLQRNPFLLLVFSDLRQRNIAWGGCLLWCTGVKRVSNFEITATKCGLSSAIHSAQQTSA